MSTLATLIAAAFGAFLIDRLGLWTEEKGWIYYRKKKPKLTSLGSGVEELNRLLNPSAKYTIEMKQMDSHQRDDQGDGPDPKLREPHDENPS